MTFGEKLKEARKEAGLTQEELATKLSVSRQAVDTAIWLLTDAPPGTIELAQSWNNIDNAFYLVRRKEKNLLVLVTADFIESRTLTQPIEKMIVRQRAERKSANTPNGS